MLDWDIMNSAPETLTKGFLRSQSIELLFLIESRLEEDIATASDPEDALSAMGNLRLVRSFIAVRELEAQECKS